MIFIFKPHDNSGKTTLKYHIEAADACAPDLTARKNRNKKLQFLLIFKPKIDPKITQNAYNMLTDLVFRILTVTSITVHPGNELLSAYFGHTHHRRSLPAFVPRAIRQKLRIIVFCAGEPILRVLAILLKL